MSRVNQTNTTPELILKFREKNIYTTEKMKPCSEFENEFKKIQSKHDDEHKELKIKHDNERKELKQRHDNELGKLRNKQYQEIKKGFLRRQNRHPFRRQDTKRSARPSIYPASSGSSRGQQDLNLFPTTTYPNIPDPSRKPTTEPPSQYLSCHSSFEGVNLNLEEWLNNDSNDCTFGDPPVFNEMRYPDNSRFYYLNPSYTYYHGNSTFTRDDQENSTKCQYSNSDMTNANYGSYLGRMGS
ncbi:14346_t:CDS:2 [Gigaspora margarita]|uniref:14346_t:CDS:1 n=1 Tax=Gigaspora margarita TaxID=4874 RepID=A0ABN7UCQ9_GIGMA|nr:14346_t:CDS:2 [Gigaspora margarita]